MSSVIRWSWQPTHQNGSFLDASREAWKIVQPLQMYAPNTKIANGIKKLLINGFNIRHGV